MKKVNYEEAVHVYGRIWMLSAFVMMLMIPTSIGVYYGAWPELSGVVKGLLGVAPIFWTVAVIEIITYTPMLGSGGSYLGFVTGNLTNLKVPCALYAMENAKVKQGTLEGEVISTIAIATSSIVTTIIIAVGVLMLTPLTPILNSDFLKPAFDNILPALFGGLAVVYVSKNWKIAMAPLIFMITLFVWIPSLAHSVSVLVPVGSLIAIVVARLLYVKGHL
ncbi:hypothetical protein [Alkaliphilus peptidifermentans]|uniref:Uncharacterized protein n=1 Tax=Alkaliphilus peptidifermentans DSM 18978 TaxID=1120976 RepID=A0A1G5J042_9FIRM|nr:hypothetical protein [Alkaliphilus peptidifermentans]SCY81723.1 hypothetical protein SAMN03080606_02590 [Alkaliphilus peptidifermentans DSM 18978]